MSCCFRHMKNILDEVGIEVTRSNRKDIDQSFNQIVCITYKDCPTNLKMLKQDLIGDAQKRLLAEQPPHIH